jgi:hypothetical protein
MRILPLATLLALGACALETTYVPVGQTNGPMEQARARCQFQTASSPALIVNGGLSTSFSLMETCMRGEGYATVVVRR